MYFQTGTNLVIEQENQMWDPFVAFGSGLIVSGLQRSQMGTFWFWPRFSLVFVSCNVGGISRETLCYAECLLCGVLSRGVFLTRFLVSRKCLSIWDSQETIQERKIMPRSFSLPFTWVYSREQNDSVMRNHDNPGGLLAPFQLCWEGLSIWDLGQGKNHWFFLFHSPLTW